MKKAQRIIFWLRNLFAGAWYINLILAGSAIVFQVLNFFIKHKNLSAPYLGMFTSKGSGVGLLNLGTNTTGVFTNSFSLEPFLVLDSVLHHLFVMMYTMVIISMVLFYNYQLKALFSELYTTDNAINIFKYRTIHRFHLISRFSVVVFIVGTLLSLLKIGLIDNVVFESYTIEPIFDRQVLNFLWIGLGFYLVAIIFKVGLVLKEENELTI